MQATEKCEHCDELNSHHKVEMFTEGIRYTCSRCSCMYFIPKNSYSVTVAEMTTGFKSLDSQMSAPMPKQGDRSNKLPPYNQIPHEAMRRLALTFAEGIKYDKIPIEGNESSHYKNWMFGLPFSETMDHIQEHLLTWIENQENGELKGKEDDLAHAAWGLLVLMWMELHRPDMNDIKGRNPNIKLWNKAPSSDNSSR